MKNSATVTVSKETYSRLFRRKSYPEESMELIIKKLLDKDTPGYDPTSDDKKSQGIRHLLITTKKGMNQLEEDILRIKKSHNEDLQRFIDSFHDLRGGLNEK